MMDHRTIELIHGEIDGVNSPDDQRELQRRLEASAESRRELAETRALAERLAAEPAYDLPPGLRDMILARIALPPANRPARSPRSARNWLGAAVAMAATVAGVAIVVMRAPDSQQLDPSNLAGTIGQPAAGVGTTSLLLDDAAVSGSITLRRYELGLTIDIKLDSVRPVAVVARADQGPLELQGFLPLQGSPARLDEDRGTIRLLHRGRQHYSLAVTSGSATASVINLQVYDGERLIRESRLELPGGAPPRRE
jgi:hypothetical protein